MVLKKEFSISAFGTDEKFCARPHILIGYLQDTAGLHCIPYNQTGLELIAQGRAWVLNHMKVKFHSYPYWSDKIHIETWVNNKQGFRSRRDFEMFNEQGDLMVSSASCWVVIDTEKRKPVPITPHVECFAVLDDRIALQEFKPKVPQKPDTSVNYRESFSVRPSDLDFNSHLTSIRYIEWALNSLPLELQRRFTVDELHVSYLQEAFPGDQIDVHTYGELPRFTHSLFNDKGAELARMTTKWKERESGRWDEA